MPERRREPRVSDDTWKIIMTRRLITDASTPIGEILKSAGAEGILLELQDQVRYAVIPLNDDVLDLLIERSPKFRDHCQEIRQRMKAGQFQSHADVRQVVGQTHEELLVSVVDDAAVGGRGQTTDHFSTSFSGQAPTRPSVAALCLFNDAILASGRRFGLPVIDRRIVCSEIADYANEIEPSAAGAVKIADATCQLLTSHELGSRQALLCP